MAVCRTTKVDVQNNAKKTNTKDPPLQGLMVAFATI